MPTSMASHVCTHVHARASRAFARETPHGLDPRHGSQPPEPRTNGGLRWARRSTCSRMPVGMANVFRDSVKVEGISQPEGT